MIDRYIQMSFVKVVAISALLFLVLVTIFKIIVALFGGETLTSIISKMATVEYVLTNLIGAIVYGVAITFYYKRKYKKQ